MTEFAPIPREAAPPGARVLFAPNAFQERALRASADEVLLGGAKGPGKTKALLMVPLRWAHREAMAIAFVRESFRELQRPLDEAHRFYSQLPTAQRPAWNGDLKRFTWPSRGFVQFGYADTIKNITWTQGGNWTHILYDEVGNQPNERVIDTLLSEIRSPDKAIHRQFIGSANPGFAGHAWLKRRFIVPCGKQGERIAWSRMTLPNGEELKISRQFVPGRVTDNPILFNDARYMARLMSLPERLRRCLMDGDWDAATGMALDEVNPSVHLVPPFEPPPHWPYIAAFDWGFSHWAVFMWGRVSDDGRIYICDTIRRRLLRDWDLVATFLELVPSDALRVVHAGHDCWGTGTVRGAKQRDGTRTTAEYFGEQGINLVQANIARVSGYRNLLHYLAWQETEFLPQRQPMLQFFDTPGNRWAVEEQLPAMVLDPDNPTDVLKVDADPEDGAGGDDAYDTLRMLCASRPLRADSIAHLERRSAWDDDVLRRAAAEYGRVETTTGSKRRKSNRPPMRD